MRLTPSTRALMLVFAALFTSCAQYATVSTVRPRFRPLRNTLAALATVEQEIDRGSSHERSKPMEALGDYLAAAEAAAQHLQHSPDDTSAREAYNFAVSRVFTTIQHGKLDPWSQPLRVPAPGGDYLLTYRAPKVKVANPALYDFTPADEFDVKGTYVTERTVKPGVGAPLVVIGKDIRADAKVEFVPSRTYYGITAVAQFAGNRDRSGARLVTLNLQDPLNTETTTLGGRTFPLTANFTVPLAVMLARENPKKLEVSRVLRPEKYAETAHIVRLQPYDPEKTVVIVTHGLMDSPATWAPLINVLRGDPVIRQNYQFWFYSYPSGYPYPYSASIMREQLDAVERKFPLKKKIVLIGHSMGSMISRLMITDSGDKIWMNIFGKPPAEVKMSAKTRELLEPALIFRHRSEVGRVIFIAGPHRGSEMATNWVGRLASSLVKAPVTLLKVGNEMRKSMTQDATSLQLKRIPNSVDTLAPNNRFVKIVNTIPITPGIPYHSIMGDRGKGGNKDKTAPESSDGIVPYWSSHLDGAQSELIVPSSHSAHQNPQAIAEVRRILLQAAK